MFVRIFILKNFFRLNIFSSKFIFCGKLFSSKRFREKMSRNNDLMILICEDLKNNHLKISKEDENYFNFRCSVLLLLIIFIDCNCVI